MHIDKSKFKEDFDNNISSEKIFTAEEKYNILNKAKSLDTKHQRYNLLKPSIIISLAAVIIFLLVLPNLHLINLRSDNFDYKIIQEIDFPINKEEIITILGDNYVPVIPSDDSLEDVESLRWDYPLIKDYEYIEEYDFLDIEGIKEGKLGSQVIVTFRNEEVISISMLYKEEDGSIYLLHKNKDKSNKIPMN
ncbi:hypothetical protein ACFVAD_21600 [Sutcliffiella sp. NPDC057660]|uniref:hypothetical protein n=1 Tax=Sutcliffiella sp. NPDC057660 TaxID=3346199 RepID=UPI00369B63F8